MTLDSAVPAGVLDENAVEIGASQVRQVDWPSDPAPFSAGVSTM